MRTIAAIAHSKRKHDAGHVGRCESVRADNQTALYGGYASRFIVLASHLPRSDILLTSATLCNSLGSLHLVPLRKQSLLCGQQTSMRAVRIVTVTSTAATTASDSRCRAVLGQGRLAIASIASNLRHCWSSAALRHTRTRKLSPDEDFPVPGGWPISFSLILAFALLGTQEPGCGVARTTTEMRYVTRRTSQSAPLDASILFSPLTLPPFPSLSIPADWTEACASKSIATCSHNNPSPAGNPSLQG